MGNPQVKTVFVCFHSEACACLASPKLNQTNNIGTKIDNIALHFSVWQWRTALAEKKIIE